MLRVLLVTARSCAECGEPFFVAGGGVAHHEDDESPDGIDHGTDADHVPHGADDSFQCIDPECPGAGIYHDHPTVTLTLRRDDWDLFRETLENDAVSVAFDSELREALTAALRRTED